MGDSSLDFHPPRQTLEVLALESGRWSLLVKHEGRVSVRVVPFHAVELALGALWRAPK